MEVGNDLRARAVSAIRTAIDAHSAARDKIGQVIAVKDLNGEDASREEAERGALDVTIGNLEDEEAEYKAAQSVVSAPTQQEIGDVRVRIQEIRDIAVADAAQQAGKNLIVTILRASLDLRSKNAKA
jgi:hypothetical protein